MTTSPQQLVDFILKRRAGFRPKIGVILGSGLAGIADKIQDSTCISYTELSGFPVSSVPGHPCQLILGYLNQVPVVCCQGRVHLYEGMQGKDFKLFIRTLKGLGCESLLMTNAVGSLTEKLKTGQLVLITDHINFQSISPLSGPNEEEFGPRFFAMDDVYDKELRHIFMQTAKKLAIPLEEGIYISVLGPHFETPAEIRAFKKLGADVVGMSTVPEVIVARHCGLKVAVISVVTNLAAGLCDKPITHEDTVYFAKAASENLGQLLESAIVKIAN